MWKYLFFLVLFFSCLGFVFAMHADWNFDANTDYTYDAGLIQVVDGNASLFSSGDSNGLVSYWRFENDVVDDYGDNNGVQNGGSFVAGKVGQSISLNGTSDFVDINSSLGDLNTTTKGTWVAWVKPVDATPAATNHIIAFGDSDALELVRINMTTLGKFQVDLYDAGVLQFRLRTDSAVFSDNTWTHVAVVQDGVSPVLYVDGVAVAQTFLDSTDKTKWFNDLAGLDNGRIGDRNFDDLGEGLYFGGDIDEVALYDRTLSASDVNDIYNAGAGRRLADYNTENPSIVPNTSANFGQTITQFTETVFKPTGTEIKYHVSIDNGTTWKYWNGSAWTVTDDSYTQANTASTINTNIDSIGQTGNFKFRALLHTDTVWTTPQLDNIYIETKEPDSFNWPFTVDTNYDFNTSLMDVNGGEAYLIDQNYSSFALWHMNESSGTNVSDSSGNGRDANAVNIVDADWVAAKLNNGLSINGTKYVDCNTTGNFERTDPFSLELWVKKDDAPATQYFFSKMAASGERGWALEFMSTGPIRFYLTNNKPTNLLYTQSTTSVTDTNTFHHIFVTYDGSVTTGGVKMFIDGQKETFSSTQNTLTGTIITGSKCTISGLNSSHGFNGDFDEVAIYDTNVPEAYVIARYNGGAGKEETTYLVSTNPAIYPYNGFVFSSSLTAFVETATKPTGTEIKYQVSDDNGTTWKYWNGSSWVVSDGTYSQANTATEVDANIGDLNTSGTFKFRALLHSDGANTPRLDNIYVTSAPKPTISSIDLNTLYDYWFTNNIQSLTAYTVNQTDGHDLNLLVRWGAEPTITSYDHIANTSVPANVSIDVNMQWSSDTNQVLYVRAYDSVSALYGATLSLNTAKDTTAPSISVDYNSQVNSPVAITVTATATDAGINGTTIFYSVDGGVVVQGNSVYLDVDGNHVITWHGVDALGNDVNNVVSYAYILIPSNIIFSVLYPPCGGTARSQAIHVDINSPSFKLLSYDYNIDGTNGRYDLDATWCGGNDYNVVCKLPEEKFTPDNYNTLFFSATNQTADGNAKDTNTFECTFYYNPMKGRSVVIADQSLSFAFLLIIGVIGFGFLLGVEKRRREE